MRERRLPLPPTDIHTFPELEVLTDEVASLREQARLCDAAVLNRQEKLAPSERADMREYAKALRTDPEKARPVTKRVDKLLKEIKEYEAKSAALIDAIEETEDEIEALVEDRRAEWVAETAAKATVARERLVTALRSVVEIDAEVRDLNGLGRYIASFPMLGMKTGPGRTSLRDQGGDMYPTNQVYEALLEEASLVPNYAPVERADGPRTPTQEEARAMVARDQQTQIEMGLIVPNKSLRQSGNGTLPPNQVVGGREVDRDIRR